MKEQYFNLVEFRKAMALIPTNPLEAKRRLEEYFEKYPDDLSARPCYTYILLILGEFKEARQFLEHLKMDIQNNPRFCKHKDKVEYAYSGMKMSHLRILAREKRYQEFCDCLEQFPYALDDDQITFFCKTKLGLTDGSRDFSSYMMKQIAEFHEEDFMEHVQRHTADYNRDLDYPNMAIFAPDFPLEDVIQEVKRYIPSEKRLCFGFFEDTYVFQYDACGRDFHKLVDYFQVVCFDDEEHHLITMYPSNNCENLPSIDLNYMKPEEDHPKVKSLSQIEKFNRRYSM